MVQIPMISSGPVTKQSVLSINQKCVQGPKSSHNIASINTGALQNPSSVAHATTVGHNTVQTGHNAVPVDKPAPALLHTVRKGQKIPLETQGKLTGINACLGWNTLNAACDVDVSAFLLDRFGKVPSDTWFVFYGQTKSPDGSTRFLSGQGEDRESISIDFTKLSVNVQKIVFVLTINEAFERNLNFSMLKDAYVRIMDQDSNREIASFKMDEYYSNVTSMMIGEIYRYNDRWKFNAIGNGVARDLAGLCEFYGVQVI